MPAAAQPDPQRSDDVRAHDSRADSARAESVRAETMRALQRVISGASTVPGVSRHTIPTDLAPLNSILPEGGFPTASVVEWISDLPGLSATTIALHCLRPFLSQPGCLAVVDSDHDFYALAAQAVGIPLKRMLLIRPEHSIGQDTQTPTDGLRMQRRDRLQRRQKDCLWALEQAARCPGVRVVLCWLERASSTALRRLQLAVERSGVTVFLIRPPSVLKQPSWADLRLRVSADQVPGSAVDVRPAVNRHIGAQQRIISVSVLKSRQAVVQQQRQILLKIDDETGAVLTIPELADSATAATAAR